MNCIGKYKNGNYVVYMMDDGTKIRANNLDTLNPMFPESIDIKISNRCDRGCPMCHEQSTPDGDLADLNHPILDSLRPYTELAIGGGNPLEHPDLENFLERMKRQCVICNMTVHVDHFLKYYDRLKRYRDSGLIHGLGISVNAYQTEYTLNTIANFPDAVVHVIAGVVPYHVLQAMFDKGIRLLILGYKNFGRGKAYIEHYPQSIINQIRELETHFGELSNHFKSISFDNLAIVQLGIQNHVSEDDWKTYFMGSNGEFTMYIDLVKQEYAISSIHERIPLTQNNIIDVFSSLKKERDNK